MSAETINTRHRVTGKIQRVTKDQYEVFSDYLEVVDDDAKPLVPGMFKPGKVGSTPDLRSSAKAETPASTDGDGDTKKTAEGAKASKATNKEGSK